MGQPQTFDLEFTRIDPNDLWAQLYYKNIQYITNNRLKRTEKFETYSKNIKLNVMTMST